MHGRPACLAVLTGLPGTGKSTVGHELAARLGWPLIGKDAFKEIVFDELGWSDKAWSLRVSATAHRLIDYVVGEQLGAGESVIVESNFKRGIDSARIEALAAHAGARTVQLLCWARGDVLIVRYLERARTTRHPRHAEGTGDEDHSGLEQGRCDPLDLPGPLIEVETTDFARVDYDAIVARISSASGER